MVPNLLDRLGRANDDIARRVQEGLGWAVIHHERVTWGGPEYKGDLHKGRPLVPQYWLHGLEILGDMGMFGLLTVPPSRVVRILQGS